MRFARRLARLERDARTELGMTDSGEPTRLSIAVNADSPATRFLPALSRVPPELGLCFELRREDEDHSAALLREGVVMAAVTSSPEPVAGCVRALGRMRYLPAASPAFAERWLGAGTEASLRDLIAEAPVVAFDRNDDFQDDFVSALRGGPGASALRHFVPTSEGFTDTVVAGLGWGPVPEPQAVPLLRAGRLVDLAPDRTVEVPLFWQQWKLDFPALAAVAEAVAAVAARTLATGPPVPTRR